MLFGSADLEFGDLSHVLSATVRAAVRAASIVCELRESRRYPELTHIYQWLSPTGPPGQYQRDALQALGILTDKMQYQQPPPQVVVQEEKKDRGCLATWYVILVFKS